MFGQGKFNAGVIIDPVPDFQFDCGDKQKLAEFRNLIWFVFFPTSAGCQATDRFCRENLDRANEHAPQHSRLFKEVRSYPSCSAWILADLGTP